jgi:hypothetical protein
VKNLQSFILLCLVKVVLTVVFIVMTVRDNRPEQLA